MALSDGPRTMNEVARVLGKPAGSIYGTVQRMRAEELVVADSDPPTRGTLYELASRARAQLELNSQGGQLRGVLAEGQRVLFVDGDIARAKVQRLFAQRALVGCVAWIAETDGARGLLLAMHPETARNDVQRLAVALDEIGLRCSHQRIGELFGPSELREEAISALDLAESAAAS